jgi:hypothetical protein
MIPDKIQKEEFNRNGNMPLAWEMTADNLLVSADILKAEREKIELSEISAGSLIPPSFVTLSVELMLRGFAVECLFKGIWLARGNKIAENGKFKGIPGIKKTHDLVNIAEKIGFPLSSNEKDILIRLTTYATGGGRYPISTSYEKSKIRKWDDGSIHPPSIWRIPDDYDCLKYLVNNLKKEIRKKSSAPPKIKKLI